MDKKNNPDIEEENHSLPVGVGIKDLRKVFKASAGFISQYRVRCGDTRTDGAFFFRSKRKGNII